MASIIALSASNALYAAELQGTISLPSIQVVTSGDIGANVRLCAYSIDYDQNYCVSQSAVIADGFSSIDFTLSYNDSPQDDMYEVSVVCENNCGPYITQKLYLKDDLSSTVVYASVVPSTLSSALDVTLLESELLTGTINLPSSNVANGAIKTTVSVCASTIEFVSIGCTEESFTISAGDDSVLFNLPIIPVNGFYKIFIKCIENCAPYLNSNQYLQGDLVTTSFNSQSIRSDLLVDAVDFTLVEGQPLAGTISLPIGDTAANDISSYISFCSSDLGTTRCFDTEATIVEGTTNVDYNVAAITASIDGTYSLSINCVTGCGQYTRDRQYLQSDLEIGFEFQAIEAARLPELVNVTLQQGRVLSGSILLPNSEVAEDDISVNIEICSYDADGVGISCDRENFSIVNGSNSVPYSLSVRPAPDEGFYRISSSCQYGCGLYLTNTRFIQTDLSIGFQETDISATLLPNLINISLEKGTVVTGLVSLPGGVLAQEDISNSFEVCSFDASSTRLSCSYQFGDSTITEGSSSAPYAISVRPAPADGFYQFSSTCGGSCGLYLQGNRYLQTDLSFGFDPVNVAASDFPSKVDFDLAEGQLVSGVISLPGGKLADERISNYLSICSYDSQGDRIDCSTRFHSIAIDIGSNSTPYAISVRPAPLDGFYRVSTRCSSNCGLNIENSQYLQSDLTTGFTETNVSASILPSIVNFTLSEGRVIAGSISLPNSELAGNEIYNEVRLCTYDINENQLGCANTSVVIEGGANSAAYATSILSAPSGGSYRLYTRCSSSCGLYLGGEHYLQADLSYDFVQANLTENQLPLAVDFVLTAGQTVSGLIKLPNGESAENDIITTVQLCSYDSNGSQVGCSNDINNSTIESGAISELFAVSVRPAPTNGYYQLSSSCSSGCGLYLTNTQYLLADLGFGFVPANVPTSVLPLSVDFTLSKGQVLSGTIGVPSDAIAQIDIHNTIEICTLSEIGYSIDCRSIFPVIPAGSAATPYAISISPAPNNGSYSVTTSCSLGCGLYLRDTQHLQADMSINFEPSTIDSETLPSSVDFVLPRGQELNGSIKLLGGALAPNDLYNTLSICAHDAASQLIRCNNIEVVMLKDSNSASYSVSLRNAPDGGFYRVSNKCSNSCGLYLTDTLYLQTDFTTGFEPALVASSTLPDTVDFTLNQGQVINVTLALPNNSVVTEAISNDFQICSYDDLGGNIDCSSAYSRPRIAAGDISVSFSISVRPATPSGFYRVITRCSGNCGLYLSDRQYLQPDLTAGFEPTFIPASALPSSVIFSLVKGKVFTFNLSLPNAEIASKNISNYVSLCSYDSQGGNVDCANSFDGATIASGANNIAYALAVRPAPIDGSYEVATQCRSDCDLYLDSIQYLQADLTIGFQKARIPALIFPETTSFILPTGKELGGNISLPNNRLASATIRGSVMLCSYDLNGRSLDCNSVEFVIPAGSNNAQYVLSVNAAPSDGSYRLSSSCSFNCDSFLRNTQYLQNDLNIGFELDNVSPGNLPEIVDFKLSEGQVLSGAIALPDSELAVNTISNRVEICAYDADGDYLNCRSKFVSIVSGTNSIDYELSIRPAPIDGYYRLSSQCNSNCGQYLDVAQHVQADLSLGFEGEDIPASTFPQTIDIELTQGFEFAGNILLPNSEVALGNIDNRIDLCSFDENNQLLDCSNTSVSIVQGNSTQGYAISVRPSPSGGFYRLSTQCQSNCSRYLDTTRYLQPDLSIDFDSVNVPALLLPESVDFILTKGVVVSGKISLPDDEVALNEIGNQISLCAYDDANRNLGCEATNIVIADDENSGVYQLSIRPVPLGGFYRLSTYCSTGCGLYLNNTQYLQQDLSIGFAQALVPEASIPDMVDIVLTKGRVLTGEISLPNSELADGDITNSIRFCTYDENDLLLDCKSSSIIIQGGTSSGNYEVSNRLAPSGGYYQVSTRCLSRCGLFLGESQYLLPDLSYRFISASDDDFPKISEIDLPTTINFVLDRGLVIVGSLSLPDSKVADEVMLNTVELCAYKADNSPISCTQERVTIVVGLSRIDFTFSVLAAPSDGYYKVSTRCTSNCSSYLKEAQYLHSDLSVGSTVELIPALAIPASIDFTLLEGKKLTGTIRLPGLTTLSNVVFNSVTLCSYTAEGIELQCRQDSPFIFAGDLSANYTIDPIRLAPDTGFYRVFTRCIASCGLNLTEPQYLQADGTTSFDIADIPASSLPDTVNFTLLTLAPDSYENDNDLHTASIVNSSVTQNHNIHVPGDEDWVQITLSKSGNLSLFAKSDRTQAGLTLELFNSNLIQVSISEISNLIDSQNVSTLEAVDLSVGTYYLKINSESLSDTVASYELMINGFVEEKLDPLCVPIRARNGNIAMICL